MCLRKTVYVFVCLALMGGGAFGASYTWTPTAAGTYSWDDAASKWTSGFPNAIDDVANLNISFDGNQTINLNQAITVGSINIGDQNDARYAYTISAGTSGSFVFGTSTGDATLTRTGGNGVQDLISANVLLNTNMIVSDATGSLDWGVDRSIKFSGIISGVGSITKIGNGALSLEGANTYSGGLIISNGYLQIRHANAAGKGPFVIGTPECASPIPWINMHNGAGVTITNEVILIGDYISHQGFACTGPIRLARSGIRTKCNMSGSGIVTDLNGSNTLNGLDINLEGIGGWGGTLSLSGNILMYTNQVMTHDSGWGVSAWQGSISGVISDGGNGFSLTKAGTAGTYLNGANTYSGDTSVSAGRLLLGNNLALQNSAIVTVSGGFALGSGITTPTIGGLKGSVDLTTTFASGYSDLVTSLTLNPGTGKTNTYSGTIVNGASGMVLAKTGAGTQELNGSTTVGSLTAGYRATGGTVSSSGTLSVGSGSTSGLYIGVAYNGVNGSGVLDAANAAAFTVNVSNLYVGICALYPFGGGSSGGSGAVGTGTLRLGTNNTITALNFVVGGGDPDDNTGIAGSCNGYVTTANEGTTTISAPVMAIGTAKGTQGTFTLGTNATLNLGTADNRTALIVGRNIATANTTTGTMNLSTAGGVANLYLSRLFLGYVTAGGTITGTMSLSGSSSNNLNISGPGSVLIVGANTNSTGTAAGTLTIGNIGASSAITSTDNGAAIVIGKKSSGTSTGTLNLNGGTLTITTTGTAISGGGGTGSLNLKDCTLKAGVSSTNWISGLTMVTLTNNVTFDSDEYDIVIAQPFSGPGGLTKTGIGTLTLTATNTFTGAVVVSNGTFQLGNGTAGCDGAVSNASSVTVEENAVLAYNLNANSDPAYAIGGMGSVVKTGPGMLVFSNANTYIGTTTVSNGVLKLTAANALASGTVVYLYSGATNDLSFTGSNIVAGLYIDGVIQPAGTYGTVNVDYTNTVYFTGTGALCVRPPSIMNFVATEVGAYSARLNACLYAPGVTYDVYVHFGTSDGGTNFDNWATNYYVDSWTDTGSTNISYLKTGLSEGTTCYYTFRVTNATTNCWAAPSRSFTVPSLPVVSTLAPTNIGVGSATLKGLLDSKGTGDPTVYTYWGSSDGGTNKSAWGNVYTNGVLAPGVFTNHQSGLYYGLRYYYRTYATNAYGDRWAGSSTNFLTVPYEKRGEWPVNGLVGMWNFDDGTPNDSSGNSYHGTAVNSPTYSSTDTVNGKGKSLVLASASSQYVKVDTGGSQTVFDGTNNMTISAWVKGWPGTWNPFVCKNGEPYGWQMRRYSSENRLSYTRRNLGNSDFPGSTTIVSDGNWHMVTMTFNGSSSKIYVDTALDATDNNSGTISSGNSMMCFGARDNSGFASFFNGKLDDIFFYNRALTPAEITNLYNIVGTTGLPLGYSVSNSAATYISDGSASLNGLLSCSGAVFNVYAHWNTSNGGTSISAWTNSVFVGSWTNLNSTSISKAVSGLTADTLYYFTFRATNVCTNIWATNVLSFTTYATPTVPVVDNDGGITNQTDDGCTLRGELTNGVWAHAWICWGDEDGGTVSTDRWDHVDYIGTVAEDAAFSNNVSGLSTNLTYWYRCYVSNGAGTDWSDTPTSFNAPPSAGIGGGGYSMQITFSNFAGRGVLTNFPALVKLTTNNTDNYAGFLGTNGYELRFWADGPSSGAELNYEIESWNSVVFTPTNLSGCSIWYKADAGVTTNASGVVQSWADQSGNGRTATLSGGSPTLVDNVVNGKPVVRFAADGNSWFSFSEQSNIRTVFWVLKEDTVHEHFLLGDDVDYHFHRGTSGNIWSASWAAGNIQSGTTRLMGSIVNGTSTALGTGYKIVSVVAVGNVTASRICNDRGISGRSWDGDIAEIIIYDRSLTGAEENQVGVYLARKYGLSTSYNAEAFDASCIWVQVPYLTNNCSIWATWGDSSKTNQPAYTTNGATWTEGYVGVWHLHETPANNGQHKDSTTNRFHGTFIDSNSNSDSGALGMIDGADNFNGDDDYVDLPDMTPDFTQGLTYHIWAYPETAASWARFITTSEGENNDNVLLARNGTSTTLQYDVRRGTTSQNIAAGVIELNKWQMFTVTHRPTGGTGGYATLYKDGTQVAAGSVQIPDGSLNRTVNYIGNSAWAGDAEFDGVLDEASIAVVERSSNWIWACWMNQGTNHNVFAEYGEVQILMSIQNIAPTAVTNNSAILNAELSASEAGCDVWVHWGATDQTTNFSWASSAYVGSWTNIASTNVCYTNSSFAPNSRYYYTFRATNATENIWAMPSWQFNTSGSTGGSVFMFW